MHRQRVVVTGIGPVTNIGIGLSPFAQALKAGKSGIQLVESLDVSAFDAKHAGEIKHFSPRAWIRQGNVENMGRAAQFAVAAARLAIEDAGLDEHGIEYTPCHVVIGSTEGEPLSTEAVMLEQLSNTELCSEKKASLHSKPAHSIAQAIAKEFKLEGETLTLGTACAAGNYAIGNAYDMIALGECDMALAGGAEAFSQKVYSGFYRLGAIDAAACRPFDIQRSGMVPGEGAGILVLESLEKAQARGARIYGEILGYGLSCDANHMVAPAKDGIVKAIQRAHKNANIRAEEIDYVCAHGTATQANDATECAAIQEAFELAFDALPPISSIKSMLGHTMGAASAIAAAACLLAMEQEFLPPTINHEQHDPNCPIDCVPNQSRSAQPKCVQNNAFGFGGNNCVLILRRMEVA